MKKSIEVTDLGKRYRIRSYQDGSLRTLLQEALQLKRRKKVPFWALENINFSVEEGEVFGIIGSNGSGKSTLLKILSKIVVPTLGRVKLMGKVNSLLEVGTGFHPELTGRENVFLNGSILGLKRNEIKKKFDQIAEFSEVEAFLETPVKHYSSGMFVRLAFAVAVHLDPDILIVDEVLSVGDLAFQKKCIRKMEEEVLQGRTVLLVSHNMDIVQRLCNRVMLLNLGKNLNIGKPAAMIEHFTQQIKTKEIGSFISPEKRNGNGLVRFEGLEILDQTNTPSRVFPAGSALTFKLKYRSNFKRIRLVDMRIAIKTLGGQPIIELHSGMQVPVDREMPGSGIILCNILSLPLNVGEYTVDLEAYHEQNLADFVPDSCSLKVVPGPFYQTGILPPSRYPVLAEFSWQIL